MESHLPIEKTQKVLRRTIKMTPPEPLHPNRLRSRVLMETQGLFPESARCI